jgi:hypothetical protein
MKKNVHNTFCTKIDYSYQWLRSVMEEGLYYDQQERDCFGTLSDFECEWAFRIEAT